MRAKILIISTLVIAVLAISGCVENANFDWSEASIDTFINNEITPNVLGMSDIISRSQLQQVGPFNQSDLKNLKLSSSSSDITTTPMIAEIVYEFYNQEQSALFFNNVMSAFNSLGSSPLKIYSMKIGDEEVIKYTGGLSNSAGTWDGGAYFWKKNRFVFYIVGTDRAKKTELVEWIVKQYSGRGVSDIWINTIYDCGNGNCESLENAKNCCKDCGRC